MTDRSQNLRSLLRFLLGTILLGAAGKVWPPYALAHSRPDRWASSPLLPPSSS